MIFKDSRYIRSRQEIIWGGIGGFFVVERKQTHTHTCQFWARVDFFLQMDGAKKCNIYTINNLAKALIC